MFVLMKDFNIQLAKDFGIMVFRALVPGYTCSLVYMLVEVIMI